MMNVRAIRDRVMGFSAYVFVGPEWGLTMEQAKALKLTWQNNETIEVDDAAGATLVAAGIAEEVL